MGWISKKSSFYTNGTVDRKAECDDMYTFDIIEDDKIVGKQTVLKSAQKGSIYYAAVRQQRFDKGTNIVGAVIVRTSVNKREYFDFSYKSMTENMAPFYYDCPVGILKLLTPTENEYALQWRENCYSKIEQNKNPDSLKNLPVGTEIKIILPYPTQNHKEGEEITLIKRYRGWSSKYKNWFEKGTSRYFSNGFLENIEPISVKKPSEINLTA